MSQNPNDQQQPLAGDPSADGETVETPTQDLIEPTDAEMEEFDTLIESYMGGIVQHSQDTIVSVTVVDIQKEHVLVDLGDKAEGVVPAGEFTDRQGNIGVAVGDKIDVLVKDRNEETGLIEVSYRDARRHVARRQVEEAFENGVPVSGKIARIVKGGVIVDMGIPCFMPASQIDDRRVENLEEWVGKEISALVIEYNARKNRAVLSRRRLIEANKQKALAEALSNLQVGDVVEGTVRNLRNFGAFVELSGIDAFVPRDQISHDRAASPTSVLKVGDRIRIKIAQIDRETGRVSASRKALCSDPWADVDAKYPAGTQVQGQVVSVARYGAFVQIEEGLTGLIHVSDLSWSKSAQKVADHVKEGDTVQAVVVSIDHEKRRMSLGLKQLVEDPWLEAERQFPRGTRVKGVVTGLTGFGAFVKLTDEVEGLIHISDFSWDGDVKTPGDLLKVGQEVEALVLKTDRESRRISLGLKQLEESPRNAFLRKHPVGSTVTGKVVRLMPTGAFIELAPKIDGFLHISQIDSERVEKIESALKVGAEVTAMITRADKATGKINLSRKAMMEKEEAEAVERYQVKDTDKGGLNLGELLKGLDLDNNGQ